MAMAATAPPVADDAEGARLIALNMALNGTPREETDRYLSENFQLSDATACWTRSTPASRGSRPGFQRPERRSMRSWWRSGRRPRR